ncbi:hypothetical protein TSAR_007314 [Trichomalopsis sarcophagae]|uniref:Uncharacterized protein n=1 Tax=Trichomalopsis sarcophagae TaxID=543379 RepID=A0A232EDH7_9HYME|nr:hypothetical protein TSAR_007314 [Trichomalopsis sarcophagae]
MRYPVALAQYTAEVTGTTVNYACATSAEHRCIQEYKCEASTMKVSTLQTVRAAPNSATAHLYDPDTNSSASSAARQSFETIPVASGYVVSRKLSRFIPGTRR